MSNQVYSNDYAKYAPLTGVNMYTFPGDPLHHVPYSGSSPVVPTILQFSSELVGSANYTVAEGGANITFVNSGFYALQYVFEYEPDSGLVAIDAEFDLVIGGGGPLNGTTINRTRVAFDAKAVGSVLVRAFTTTVVQYFNAGDNLQCQIRNNVSGTVLEIRKGGTLVIISQIA